MSLITTDEGHKNYSKDWFLMNSQSTFVVLTFFKLNEMAIVSKERKPNNLESHNSLKLSFTNIRGLRLKFADCKSLLESNSPDILALCEAKLDDSVDSGNISVRCYLSLIRKDSVTHMHGLAVYVKEDFLLLHVTYL